MAIQRNMFAMLADEGDDVQSSDDRPDDARSDSHQDDAKSDSQLLTATPTFDVPQVEDEQCADFPQDGTAIVKERPQLSPEELEARAAATRFKQMSAFLMTFHDRIHGPEEPLEDGIWGAVVHPRTRVNTPDADNHLDPYTRFRSRITPVPGSTASYENPDNVWYTPSLPAKVGFPVKVTSWPYPDHQEDERELYNFFVHSLFVGADADSPDFGKFMHQAWNGDALIVRTDGKDLSDQQVEALLLYLNDKLAFDIEGVELELEDGEEKIEEMKKIADKYLHPECLHAFFEEYRRGMIMKGLAWKPAKSPVAVTTGGKVPKACGKCYAKEPTGEDFMACADCEKRFYCSTKCKDDDKRSHAKKCFKEEDEEAVSEHDSLCGQSDLSSSDFKSDQSKSEQD